MPRKNLSEYIYKIHTIYEYYTKTSSVALKNSLWPICKFT